MKNRVSFTLYTSTSKLSKTYQLVNGKIDKSVANMMYQGTARRVTLSFDNFADFLLKVTEHQAFGYGLHSKEYPQEVVIVTKGNEDPDNFILSRTKKYYSYRKKPGILMLDHDPSKEGDSFTHDQLIAILIEIDPNIATAARVVRGSVSSGVHLSGEQPKKNGGFHIFIPVCDASDIPRYGMLLFKHLWLKGYGYIKVSSNGVMLVRSPIDAVVFVGSRIDFVAPPIISGEGIEYTPPKPKYVPGSHLDTSKLPQLTALEKQALTALVAQAKKTVRPLSLRKKEEYCKHKVDDMVSNGVFKKRAETVVKKMMAEGGKNLYAEFPLYFATGRVTVAEVLKKPTRYDQQPLADPIEGVAYGMGKAMFWWNKGFPCIHSYAHGDQTYFLYAATKDYIDGVEPTYSNKGHETAEEAYASMDEVIADWINKPTGYLGIKAPAGIGKTQMLIKHIAAKATYQFIEIYVPTHQLAQQLKRDLLAENNKLRVTVIRGRVHVDKDIVGNKVAPCNKSNLITSIQGYGYRIYENVCKSCEFFAPANQCEYLRQFNDTTQVRIFTHSQLRLRRGLDNKMPDFAIIDERFFTDLLDAQRTRIKYLKHYNDDNDDNDDLMDVIVDSLVNNKPLLANLREHYGDNVGNVLDDAIEHVNPSLPKVTSSTDPDKIEQKLRHKKTKRLLKIVALLNQLRTEIEEFTERDHSITVRLVNDMVEIANRHTITRFEKCLPDEVIRVPVLCIDADYCNKVAKLFLPGIKWYQFLVERNACITQIYSTNNSKNRFFPRVDAVIGERESEAAVSLIKDVQGIIDNVYYDYGAMLVVGYQDLVGNPKNTYNQILCCQRAVKPFILEGYVV